MSTLRVEFEIEDREAVRVIQLENGNLDAVLREVQALAALKDLYVFERDADEPIGTEIEKRTALRLYGHRCRAVLVKVNWEHLTKERHFSPATHVHRVLLWVIGKDGFNLDDTARAKANLVLPGREGPLPKDMVIGCFAKYPDCAVTLDLILKDFTNG